jgi:hypothetical protein
MGGELAELQSGIDGYAILVAVAAAPTRQSTSAQYGIG